MFKQKINPTAKTKHLHNRKSYKNQRDVKHI